MRRIFDELVKKVESESNTHTNLWGFPAYALGPATFTRAMDDGRVVQLSFYLQARPGFGRRDLYDHRFMPPRELCKIEHLSAHSVNIVVEAEYLNVLVNGVRRDVQLWNKERICLDFDPLSERAYVTDLRRELKRDLELEIAYTIAEQMIKGQMQELDLILCQLKTPYYGI